MLASPRDRPSHPRRKNRSPDNSAHARITVQSIPNLSQTGASVAQQTTLPEPSQCGRYVWQRADVVYIRASRAGLIRRQAAIRFSKQPRPSGTGSSLEIPSPSRGESQSECLPCASLYEVWTLFALCRNVFTGEGTQAHILNYVENVNPLATFATRTLIGHPFIVCAICAGLDA
jgi:hypothetical protein